MADKEITDLTDGGAAASGDLVHAVRDPNSRMVALGDAAGKDTGTGSGDVAAGDHTHAHFSATDNPHSVTKSQVGLGNVTNDAQIPLAYLDTDTALAANSDTKVASQKAVKAYADSLIAAADAMTLEGSIDCSSNPDYPAADAGHVYVVSVAGKIGGGSGPNVEIGDRILCITDSTSSGNHATVGSNWVIGQANIDGAVTLDGTQTLTNKTLTAPTINSPTGLVKADVGLSNVTNDAQIPATYLDTDTTLAADSDSKVPTQKAVKAYADAILTTIRDGVSSAYDTLAEIATELGNKVATSRTITSGSGLTGGGDLSANRTLAVGAGTGISVNADDVQIASSHNAVNKQTIPLPAMAWAKKAAKSPTLSTYADVNIWEFSGSSEQRVRTVFAMPKGWNLGTVTYRVFCVVDTGGSSGHSASWKMAAQAYSHDDALFTTTDLSTGTIELSEVVWTANDDLLISSESGALTIQGSPAAGDLILFELWRDPADANDDSSAAWGLFHVEIYYTPSAAHDA